MLAGRWSNEESSILRLWSSLHIAWRWMDELAALLAEKLDGHVGGPASIPLCTHQHSHVCWCPGTEQ